MYMYVHMQWKGVGIREETSHVNTSLPSLHTAWKRHWLWSSILLHQWCHCHQLQYNKTMYIHVYVHVYTRKGREHNHFFYITLEIHHQKINFHLTNRFLVVSVASHTLIPLQTTALHIKLFKAIHERTPLHCTPTGSLQVPPLTTHYLTY